MSHTHVAVATAAEEKTRVTAACYAQGMVTKLLRWATCTHCLTALMSWTAICIRLWGTRSSRHTQRALVCRFFAGVLQDPQKSRSALVAIFLLPDFCHTCMLCMKHLSEYHFMPQDLIYDTTAGDEVEDLLALLAFAKQKLPQLEAVCSGAIASDYQRLRVEQVNSTTCATLSNE